MRSYLYIFCLITLLVISHCSAEKSNAKKVRKFLEDGVAYQSSVVGGKYKYFSFRLAEGTITEDVVVSLAPLEQGADPDLFISTNEHTKPTKQGYTWASTGLGGEYLVLPRDDPNLTGAKATALHFGVTSRSDIRFAITVQQNNRVPMIQPHAPQAIRLSSNQNQVAVVALDGSHLSLSQYDAESNAAGGDSDSDALLLRVFTHSLTKAAAANAEQGGGGWMSAAGGSSGKATQPPRVQVKLRVQRAVSLHTVDASPSMTHESNVAFDVTRVVAFGGGAGGGAAAVGSSVAFGGAGANGGGVHDVGVFGLVRQEGFEHAVTCGELWQSIGPINDHDLVFVELSMLDGVDASANATLFVSAVPLAGTVALKDSVALQGAATTPTTYRFLVTDGDAQPIIDVNGGDGVSVYVSQYWSRPGPLNHEYSAHSDSAGRAVVRLPQGEVPLTWAFITVVPKATAESNADQPIIEYTIRAHEYIAPLDLEDSEMRTGTATANQTRPFKFAAPTSTATSTADLELHVVLATDMGQCDARVVDTAAGGSWALAVADTLRPSSVILAPPPASPLDITVRGVSPDEPCIFSIVAFAAPRPVPLQVGSTAVEGAALARGKYRYYSLQREEEVYSSSLKGFSVEIKLHGPDVAGVFLNKPSSDKDRRPSLLDHDMKIETHRSSSNVLDITKTAQGTYHIAVFAFSHVEGYTLFVREI